MGWVLRLVETGIDSSPRVIDVVDIGPFGDLGDIARLGLTLPEAKQILARLQHVVVTVQANHHALRCTARGYWDTELSSMPPRRRVEVAVHGTLLA